MGKFKYRDNKRGGKRGQTGIAVFDITKRNAFLKGFHQRKEERREKAKKQKEEEKRQERKEIKQNQKEEVLNNWRVAQQSVEAAEKALAKLDSKQEKRRRRRMKKVEWETHPSGESEETSTGSTRWSSVATFSSGAAGSLGEESDDAMDDVTVTTTIGGDIGELILGKTPTPVLQDPLNTAPSNEEKEHPRSGGLKRKKGERKKANGNLAKAKKHRGRRRKPNLWPDL